MNISPHMPPPLRLCCCAPLPDVFGHFLPRSCACPCLPRPCRSRLLCTRAALHCLEGSGSRTVGNVKCTSNRPATCAGPFWAVPLMAGVRCVAATEASVAGWGGPAAELLGSAGTMFIHLLAAGTVFDCRGIPPLNATRACVLVCCDHSSHCCWLVDWMGSGHPLPRGAGRYGGGMLRHAGVQAAPAELGYSGCTPQLPFPGLLGTGLRW